MRVRATARALGRNGLAAEETKSTVGLREVRTRFAVATTLMREMNFNTGLRGVLFEAQHYARMGAAVWLYGWLVLRQTHQTGEIGHVLGGAPIAYREIEEETGFNRRTLETWMRVLRREGYIETQSVPSGISVRILKAKKHLASAPRSFAQVRVRGVAEGVREAAYGATRSRVGNGCESDLREVDAPPIGSSSVVRIKDKSSVEIHTPVENSAHVKESIESETRLPEDHESNRNPSWLRQIKTQLRNHNPMPGPARDAFGNFQNPRAQQAEPLATQNEWPEQRTSARPASQQQFSSQERKRFRALRRERDEQTRRDLYVGTGPEGRR